LAPRDRSATRCRHVSSDRSFLRAIEETTVAGLCHVGLRVYAPQCSRGCHLPYTFLPCATRPCSLHDTDLAIPGRVERCVASMLLFIHRLSRPPALTSRLIGRVRTPAALDVHDGQIFGSRGGIALHIRSRASSIAWRLLRCSADRMRHVLGRGGCHGSLPSLNAAYSVIDDALVAWVAHIALTMAISSGASRSHW